MKGFLGSATISGLNGMLISDFANEFGSANVMIRFIFRKESFYDDPYDT